MFIACLILPILVYLARADIYVCDYAEDLQKYA
jgi:hypothetical protein